ncbi:MAG: DUF2169 domain-containing protein [Byssovorax sp.]
MEIVSLSGLPVGSLLWQKRPGQFMLTVVCKATFSLQQGEMPLAAEQEPINESDRPWSQDIQSLYAAADLVPIKPRVDVILVGQAYAPEGMPQSSLVARITVGDVDKSVEIFGDRVLRPDGSIQEGPPFTRMPLLYERAAGGPSTQNPVGMSFEERDAYGGVALPNLLVPGAAIRMNGEPIEPIGFGPIASTWPVRLDRLGRHASMWSPDHLHRRALPDDVDPAYFNAAPPDQRSQSLRDDEHLFLDNLHPEHDHLAARLPGIRPQAFVDRRGNVQEVQLRCDTLWIDTARLVCTLTWRGHVSLERALEDGTVYFATAQPSQKLTFADMRARFGVGGDPKERESTLVGTPAAPPRETPFVAEAERPKAMTLPFARSLTDALSAIADGSAPISKTDVGLPFAAPPPSPSESALPFASTPKAEGGLPFQPQADSGLPFLKKMPAPAAEPSHFPLPPPPPPLAPPPVASAPAPPAPVAPLPVAPPPVISAPIGATPNAPKPADSPWANASSQRPLSASASPAPAPGSTSSTSFDKRGGSALDASNAASAPWSPSPLAAAAAPSFTAKEAPAPRPAPRLDPNEAIQLLWYDPESLPRIRRVPRWQKLLREMSDKAPDEELDDPELAADPMELEDRREVFELLAAGDPADTQGVEQTLTSAIRPDGKFLPQLNLLAGDLQLPFDELETLKATTTTVAPLVGQDEALKVSVEVAKEFLRTPGLLSSAATAEGLTNRIKDSFGAGRRMVPQGYLEQQVERVLLEKRAYSRREVFGGRFLRAFVHLGGSSSPVPTYLPEAVAAKLPMFQRFKARMVVEVDFTVDQYESHQAALKVVALARLMQAGSGRR